MQICPKNQWVLSCCRNLNVYMFVMFSMFLLQYHFYVKNSHNFTKLNFKELWCLMVLSYMITG